MFGTMLANAASTEASHEPESCTWTTTATSMLTNKEYFPFLAASLTSMVLCLYLLQEKFNIIYHTKLWIEYLTTSVPTLDVPMTDAESKDDGVKSEPLTTADKLPMTAEVKDEKTGKKVSKLNCYDPSTKQFLGYVTNMSKEDVDEILVNARVAQKEWSKTSWKERRLVLRTIQKYICAHVGDICRVSSRESGKPKIDAVMGEILTTCEKIRTICEWGELWLQPQSRPTGPMMIHKSAWVEYSPLGVIVAIAPWNYPFHNSMNHIISGIMAGNAVVGKVSEHASWSAQYYGQIVQKALEVHGHNPNLVATVTGMAEAGQALTQSKLVDKIIFTGSTPIGRKVMESAAQNLTPVVLELGGKDAMCIRHDVNLATILPFVMRGCFQNSGQNCVGVERVLVYESIYDDFVKAIVPKVEMLRQGVPLATTCGRTGNYTGKVDCGSMIMPEQLQIVQNLVDDAVKSGAKLLCGGKINTTLNGQFFEPTILSEVTPDMNIYQQEVFGPVMTIVKVPNDSDDECIKLVNQCDFGLGSSIFSGDATRALRVGQQFQTGMLTVNDYASNYLVQSLPFGGCKESGFGRFAGIEGLRELCHMRSVAVDRIPGVKTAIPTPIDYPIQHDKGIPFTDSLVQLFYNENILDKIKAIFGLIKNG